MTSKAADSGNFRASKDLAGNVGQTSRSHLWVLASWFVTREHCSRFFAPSRLVLDFKILPVSMINYRNVSEFSVGI